MRSSSRLRLLLVLLALTAFTFTALDFREGGGAGAGGPFAALRRGADTVFGPALRAVGGGARSVGGALGGLGRLDGLQEENERLRRENERLVAELRAVEDLRRRVAEWDELMRLKDFGTYTVKPGYVTAVGSALGFGHTAKIDLGSRDGIKPGMTVVNGQGLVGRTTQVGSYTSTVLLIADRGFVVGARLTRSAALGTAEGRGPRRMEYELFDQEQQIREGDVIVTTGSDTFVRGVPVGRITEVRTSEGMLTRTAELEPFVDVGSLDLIAVVVEPPRSEPRLPIPPSPLPTPAPTVTPTPGPSGSARPSPSASPRA